jgi:Bacterial capsule synthesis protein PGA_cap
VTWTRTCLRVVCCVVAVGPVVACSTAAPARGTNARSTPKPAGPATVAAPPTTITVGWTGDTVPSGSDYGLPPDPNGLFAGAAAALRQPDLMIGNMEGTLTTRGTSKCGAGAAECYAFRSPPSYATVFKQAGFDLMSMANNHSLDFGPVGLADTQAALSTAGLPYTGMPGQVTVVNVHGVSVAVVGFAPYDWTAPLNDPAAEAALVSAAANRAAVVVVIFHGGGEGVDFQHVPNETETDFGEDRGNVRQFAHIAVDHGADLVLGDGPHVIRGMEFYRGKLIAYSAGNLIGYHVLSDRGPLGVGTVLDVALTATGDYDSATVTPMQMSIDGGAGPDAQRRAISEINALSAADFPGTGVHVAPNGGVTAVAR